MVAFRPFTQERVYFVDEHDARLRFTRQREQAGDELVRLAVPLVGEDRRGDVDERRSGLFGEGLCEHRLAAAWGAEQ